jgi:hypothetical protein
MFDEVILSPLPSPSISASSRLKLPAPLASISRSFMVLFYHLAAPYRSSRWWTLWRTPGVEDTLPRRLDAFTPVLSREEPPPRSLFNLI